MPSSMPRTPNLPASPRAPDPLVHRRPRRHRSRRHPAGDRPAVRTGRHQGGRGPQGVLRGTRRHPRIRRRPAPCRGRARIRASHGDLGPEPELSLGRPCGRRSRATPSYCPSCPPPDGTVDALPLGTAKLAVLKHKRVVRQGTFTGAHEVKSSASLPGTVEERRPSGWTLPDSQAFAERYHGPRCAVNVIAGLPKARGHRSTSMRPWRPPTRVWGASLRRSSGRCCLPRTWRTSRAAASTPRPLYALSCAQGMQSGRLAPAVATRGGVVAHQL